MVHTSLDSRFDALIDPAAPVRQIASGCTFTEGPLWHPKAQHLLFSDMPADVRRMWSERAGVQEVLKPSNKGNGLTFDTDMNLLVCEHATSAVARFQPDGTREVLASHFEGKELNSPNDLCMGSDGAIYFTDPVFGRMEHYGVPRPLQLDFQGVYRLAPGHRPGDEAQLVVDRKLFGQPNGLCFSPCERFMWVNDTEQANIRMFDVGADGGLENGRIFAADIAEEARAGRPDGMKADQDGNIYVTGPGGIWVYDFKGVKLGEIEIPEPAANLHWGGADWRTLYVCATTGVYEIPMRAKGREEPFMQAG